MGRLRASSVMIMACCGIVACGSTGKGATHSPSAHSDTTATGGATTTAATGSTPTTVEEIKRDQDKDRDNPTNSYYDKDDSIILPYGRAGKGAEEKAIASVVKRYLAAATSADGATACRLLYPVLAESIPEEYGHSAGTSALQGNTCAIVMSKLFKQEHQELAEYQSTLKVTGVRTEGSHGWAMLSHGSSGPRRFFRLHREGRTWTIGETFPNGLP